MGCIGIGGQGGNDTNIFLACPDVQILAVCDVDAAHRDRARKSVDDRSGARSRGCSAHNDFREILQRSDIDAVMIATPDHWHAVISILAAQAGKHIYCEKPISLTVAEGRAVADTMRRLRVVYQSGTQRRSVGHFRFACELVRNCRIGKLLRIIEYLGAGPSCPPQPEQPVPKGFDYDMWLGPAPWAPYTPARCHGSFRWLLDYSGGKITDQGAHFIDIAQWANDTEHTGPLEYEGRGTFPKDGLYNTPITYHVTATYANGVKLEITDPLIDNDWAIRFEGTDGWLLVTRNDLHAQRPSLLEPLGRHETPLPRSDHHQRDFLNALRTRRPPIAPPETAHRSTTICHLAVLCLRLGRKLTWDPVREQCVGDNEANRLLSRAHREPWAV
jgi:predicted dehydrogenase